MFVDADMQHRRLFFRILYASIYVVFFLVLLGLLLITPGDAIERSLNNNQKYNVLILTISYVVTVVIVVFVYILRLYITKTAIAAIPKTWVPIDKGDVKDAVYKMIHSGLSRSAVIAYEARPREQVVDDKPADEEKEKEKENQIGKANTVAGDLGLLQAPRRPVWGEIEHDGWASPNSPDLPNLQYSSVISELPNLIEARALTLALPAPPPHAATGAAPATDEGAVFLSGEASMPDPRAASLLQRTHDMTLRDYVDHLCRFGVVQSDETTALFISQFEYARYSTRALSDQKFRSLMHTFAEVLRTMQPLRADVSESLREGSYGWTASESDIDNDAPLDTTPPSPGSAASRPETAKTQHSALRPQTARTPSGHAWSFRTAPNTPGSRRTTGRLSRQSSENSFAQTRREYNLDNQSSSASIVTNSSDSGSVIRLATGDDADALPYVLNLRPTA